VRFWIAVLLGLCICALPCSSTTTRGRPTSADDAAVEIIADGCPNIVQHGVGLLIEPGRILTAAHVVAGSTMISVRQGATVIVGALLAFDPVNDLAIVGVDLAQRHPVSLSIGTAGLHAAVVVFRDHRPISIEALITRQVILETKDIYGISSVQRPGYEVRTTTIVGGDSGAALVVGGIAVAMMWARSRTDVETAWAIDPVRGGAMIQAQLTRGEPVSPGPCIG